MFSRNQVDVLVKVVVAIAVLLGLAVEGVLRIAEAVV
jgi:hypothetical protein